MTERIGAAASGWPARGYWLLSLGQLASMIGTMAQYTALPLWVLRETGSAVLTGATFAIETLPIIILAPWAGAIADRYDRRLLSAGCEAASALAVIMAAAASSVRLIAGALVLAMTVKALNAISVPAMQGLIREVVSDEKAHAAIVRFQGLTGATLILGPPLGSLLFSLFGIVPTLLLNSASFVIGAISIWAIRRDQSEIARSIVNRKHQAAGGIRMILDGAHLRDLLLAEAGFFLCFGGSTAAVLVYAARTVGYTLSGWYPACIGASWVAISMLVMPWRKWDARRALVVGAALLPFTAMAVTAMNLKALVGLVIAGILVGASNSLIVAGATLAWQMLVGPAAIGQAMAIRRSATNCALVASSLLLPTLAVATSTALAIWVGAFGSVFAIGILAARHRSWEVR